MRHERGRDDLSHGGPPIPYTPPPGRACQGIALGKENETGVRNPQDSHAGAYWPSPEQALLLRAAVLPASEARAAWQALRPRVDLARLDRASLRLLPLLDANLRRHNIDDPLGDALALAREQAAARNRTLFQDGRRLLATLADAGIDTLMLKGGALAATVYGDPGLRPMSDLDVLVPTARARAAIDALERHGWAPRIAITPGFIRTQHAADLVAVSGTAKCDLHWHAYWECCRPDADVDLWAASTALDFEGVPTRALAPADQLLHVCVNGSRRARRPNLLWIPDALRLVEAGGIDWPRLLAQAAARRFALRVRTMLGYLRRAFDARVPDEALDGLGAVRVSGLERLEFRVGNRPQGLLGELPNYWCNYHRLAGGTGMPPLLGFPFYLQQTWKVRSLGETARGALTRAGQRLRAALRRHGEC